MVMYFIVHFTLSVYSANVFVFILVVLFIINNVYVGR